MIPANELRIGNWYLLGSEYYELSLKGFQDLVLFQTIDRLQPITLTPEILEKAGFGWLYNDVYMHKKHPVSIEKEEDGWYVEKNKNVVNYVPIHSLHELQNIFPFLTGEELEINL